MTLSLSTSLPTTLPLLLVTGGAGFIGANFIHAALAGGKYAILNLDKLTYAGNHHNLENVQANPNYSFEVGDIGDREHVSRLLHANHPVAIIHFAAETHVDRSIHSPDAFISTNINGTFSLLEAARAYYSALPGPERDHFRFIHVSTDEVYGTLKESDEPADENAPYRPNSPYAASKAASDHLVRAAYQTYGFPSIITNCSNNYGPFQFPEKLIPLMVTRALQGQSLPIYGDGRHKRDWLYVEDHCAALMRVLEAGEAGDHYNIGGVCEWQNIDLVEKLCACLDQLRPRLSGSYNQLISFVAERPGHDRRYALNANKIGTTLSWQPRTDFASGLAKTVTWYLENPAWTENIMSGAYREWVNQHYKTGVFL